MPREFKTPGVYRKEIDLSDIIVPAGISNGGIVVRSQYGPINRPVLVQNDKDFIEQFGEPYYLSGDTTELTNNPIPEFGYGSYAALEFLKESDTLYVVRGFTQNETTGDNYASVNISATDTNIGLSATISAVDAISVNGAPDTGERIVSIDEYASTASTKALIAGTLSPGQLGNNLAITVEPFSSSADWKFKYDDYPTEVSATSALFNDATITANSGTSAMGSTDINTYYPIASKVFKINIYQKSTAQDWTDFATVSGDNITTGQYQLRMNQVETWYGTLEPQLDGNNRQLDIATQINGNSKYIYVKTPSGATKFTYLDKTEAGRIPDATDTNGTYVREAYLNEMGGGTYDVNNGLTDVSPWDLFESREDVQVGILICPSWKELAKKAAANIAASRLDCIAVGQTGDPTKKTTTDILNAEPYGYQSPSYVSLYCGFSKIYDKYNDRFVEIPNSVFGASLMARVDNLADQWTAPAGTDLAILSVFDQNKVWSFDEIGTIYNQNINCVRFMRGYGYVMWGQKTAQLKASALDRINVRRLLLYIENNIEVALLPFVFKNNTAKVRLRVTTIIDEFLAGVAAADGFNTDNDAGYLVVCDETNNTSDIIDRNILKVDVYVKPIKTIEFIDFTTVVTKSGVSFSSVRI